MDMTKYYEVTYAAAWIVIICVALAVISGVVLGIMQYIREQKEEKQDQEESEGDEFYFETKEDVLADYYDLSDKFNREIDERNRLADRYNALLKKYQELKDKCRAHEFAVVRKNATSEGSEEDASGLDHSGNVEQDQ